MDSSSDPFTLLLSGGFYTMLDGLQSTKYLAVACFALLVYDYFLTLDQEVSQQKFHDRMPSLIDNIRLSCSGDRD